MGRTSQTNYSSRRTERNPLKEKVRVHSPVAPTDSDLRAGEDSLKSQPELTGAQDAEVPQLGLPHIDPGGVSPQAGVWAVGSTWRWESAPAKEGLCPQLVWGCQWDRLLLDIEFCGTKNL